MSNNTLFDSLDELSDEEDTRIFEESFLYGYSDFYKEDNTCKIWWIDKLDSIGGVFI